MRIISKFRDFYDGVMRTGQDREVVYVRENKSIELRENFGMDFDCTDSSSYYSVKLLFLGYCGKIMKVMDLEYEEKNPDPAPGALPTVSRRRIFYDYEEFRSFMLETDHGRSWDFERARRWGGRFDRYRLYDTKPLTDIFHRFQTPLFVLSHKTKYADKGFTTITLGPFLKGLDFHKMKDPYTTYQDIFQFVSGVLNHPTTKMVTISDKDKIHKHGFDKWSFRQKGPKK